MALGMFGGQKSQMSVDPTAPLETIFTQPSLYAGMCSFIPLYLAQVNPRDWLPKQHVGTLINGIKAERYLVMPWSTSLLLYCYVADNVMQGKHIHSHAVGLTTSLVTGLGCMACYQVSLWYLSTGLCFLTFGLTHHRNNLRIFSDNAPYFHPGDISEIWQDWRSRRQARKEERKRRTASKALNNS